MKPLTRLLSDTLMNNPVQALITQADSIMEAAQYIIETAGAQPSPVCGAREAPIKQIRLVSERRRYRLPGGL